MFEYNSGPSAKSFIFKFPGLPDRKIDYLFLGHSGIFQPSKLASEPHGMVQEFTTCILFDGVRVISSGVAILHPHDIINDRVAVLVAFKKAVERSHMPDYAPMYRSRQFWLATMNVSISDIRKKISHDFRESIYENSKASYDADGNLMF